MLARTYNNDDINCDRIDNIYASPILSASYIGMSANIVAIRPAEMHTYRTLTITYLISNCVNRSIDRSLYARSRCIDRSIK